MAASLATDPSPNFLLLADPTKGLALSLPSLSMKQASTVTSVLNQTAKTKLSSWTQAQKHFTSTKANQPLQPRFTTPMMLR